MATRITKAAPLALSPGRALALVLAPALVLLAGVFPAAAQEPPLPPTSGPEAIVGTWEGDIELPGGASLRMVFHIEADGEGGISATADSPDQGVTGMPVEEAAFEEGGELTLELRSIGASFTGSRLPDEVLDGFWNQGGQSFPLRLRRVDEVTAPERPQEPEPPLPYREEEVRYPNAEAGIELAGTLTLPEGEGPFPAVVLISGSGPQNRDSEVFGHRPFLVLSDHLTRRGIAVLRSDDRGVGESEGDFATATTRDFAGDALAAAGYLRSRSETDAAAVGLVGMSEGGLVAPMAATGSDVSFIVLLAGPGIPGDELLHLQSALIARAGGAPEEMIEWNRRLQRGLFDIVKEEPDEARRKDRLEDFLRETLEGMSEAERQGTGITRDAEEGWIGAQLEAMGGPWFRFFLLHDPAGALREVTVPVLALNGELDLQVPPDENLQAVEAALDEAGNPDVTVAEMPGLNHLFQEADTGSPAEYARIEQTMSPQVMERVADWILERAGDRP